jgi:hypothetical protein
MFSSFLHLHTEQKSVKDDLYKITEGISLTRDDLLQPYRAAQKLEQNGDVADWCAVAQKQIAGLPADYEKKTGKKLIIKSVYDETSKNFEDSRVAY